MAQKMPKPSPLAGVSNPFLRDRVDTPWQESFQDVPEINHTAFEAIQNSIRAVCRSNQSRGIVLHGEPGSGKTHLLQRLRFFTQREPRTWFIYLPPFPAPDRFWRHLLERFFYDICQRSKEPGPANSGSSEEATEGPGQGPLTQIEEALTRHLVNNPLGTTRELARWWAEICRQEPAGEPLFRRLEPTFGRLTVQCRLDPDVIRALRHYLAWNNRTAAYAYLLGRDLPDEELARLGIRQSLDDEDRARQAVFTFCRLAGPAFTILLAFDQIEGLQLNPDDLDGLRCFARNAVELLGDSENLLILTAVQSYFLAALRTALHSSYYDRLAQDESVLTLLARDSARRLIEFRLQTQPELIEIRRADGRRGALWPFAAGEVDAQVPAGGVSARQLIRWARHRFDQFVILPPVPQPPAQEAIARHWNERFAEELERPAVRLDEGIYEDGLLKLWQIKPPEGWQVRRSPEKDLQVFLSGEKEKVGLSISNTESMTSLARRLGRLQRLAAEGRVNRLIFLRDARLPISPTAAVTQQRLKELIRGGMRVIRPTAEAYAALNVLRQLWNKAAENDLTIGEAPVSMGQLQAWLAAYTPRPLRELMDACAPAPGGKEPEPADFADRLHEILAGRWIMTLEEAAGKLAMPVADLAQRAGEMADVAGVLPGPPALLFLHPEAAGRG